MSEGNMTTTTTDPAADAPPTETMAQAFARIAESKGGLDEESGGLPPAPAEKPADAPAADAKPKVEAKPAAKGKPADDDKPADEPEEKPPTVAERARWREQKRAERAKLAAERDRMIAEVRAEAAKVEERAAHTARVAKAMDLFEAGDLDGFAEAMGRRSWNVLQEEALHSMTSPVYKQLREMQRREEQRAEEDRRRAQANAEQERTAAQQREYRSLLEHINVRASSDEDPAVAEVAKALPDAVQQLSYHKIAEHYRAEGEELDAAEAARMAIRDLYANARKVVDLVEQHSEGSAFARSLSGHRGAASPEQRDRAASQPAKRGANAAPRTVSATRRAEAAGGRTLTDNELKAKYVRELTRAFAEESAR